ncbi:small subunit ribosomal protein S20 [Elusimicrobium posterum]|uniref:30S ribosomal protein S20 n=1 Tax=Elusimicrobium posterum TaxID=3116653 RepID=UPI003C739B8D
MAKLKTGRHTSAIKAQRQAEKRTSRNKGLVKTIRLSTKAVTASAKAKDGKAEELLKKASAAADKAAKKGVIHKKTAARKKSRLAKIVNSSK